jgi:hypothetical protein
MNTQISLHTAAAAGLASNHTSALTFANVKCNIAKPIINLVWSLCLLQKSSKMYITLPFAKCSMQMQEQIKLYFLLI